MKYLIMMTHSPDDEAREWTGDDVKASWAHMQQLHQEMSEAGELLASVRLAGAEATKIVTSDGSGAPVVTDGIYPESKELLAGFWMVDVESEQRAIEIAARTSASPGLGGAPSRKPLVVRPIMEAPAADW
jgi:hypothetical protein